MPRGWKCMRVLVCVVVCSNIWCLGMQIPGQFMTYFHKRGIIPKTFSSDLVQQSKAHIARARSNEP